MSHQAQIDFCKSIKRSFPEFFNGRNVLDVGSLDINGNNRYLFENSRYTGIDLAPGKNVDITEPIGLFKPGILYDFIICTEMLEHDKFHHLSLFKMYKLLAPCGGLLITCATTGREEHGTINNHPEDSPFTNDHYHNITELEFKYDLPANGFILYRLTTFQGDLNFFGIKK